MMTILLNVGMLYVSVINGITVSFGDIVVCFVCLNTFSLSPTELTITSLTSIFVYK